MNHELNYTTNNKRYFVIYSSDAKTTLWGILNPVYNSSDYNKREKATQWHWGLREQIKRLSTDFLNIPPTQISIDGSIGYYKIGNYGTIECSLLVDTEQKQAIEIREFYFSTDYLNKCLTANDETYINNARPIQNVLPNGNFIEINRRKGYYIYQHPSTKLLALTNKNGSKNTKFSFRDINWYSRRNFPHLSLQNVIAIGLDANNQYWQIDRNCNCTQLVTENKHSILDSIIAETINSFLKRELIA